MYAFNFSCIDNGGGHQHFVVKAKDKSDAIMKGLKKADKKAKGDLISWDCRFNPVLSR